MATMEFLVLGLILLVSGQYCGCEVVRLTPNVALTGTASQSSTRSDSSYPGSPFVASYAIDGDYGTSVTGKGGRCAITRSSEPVWWQVDLHRVFEINRIALTSISAGPVSWYNKNICIDVSNNIDGSSAVRCAYDPVEINKGETRLYTCPCGMYGRYVRIRYPRWLSAGGMTLCEVQIQPAGFCLKPSFDQAAYYVPHGPFRIGTEIKYTCIQCGGGISTCQLCNGTWSSVPECSIGHCSDPGPIDHGQMEGSAPFPCVSTLNYTCNKGYWLLGAGKLKCGIDKKWNHAKPLCIDTSHGCGEPPRIPSAQRLGSIASITYKCDEGYTGGGRAWCQNGQWNSNGSCVSETASEVEENDMYENVTGKNNGETASEVEENYMHEIVTEKNNGETASEVEENDMYKIVTEKNNGETATEDKQNYEIETEKSNDGLALGLAVVGSLLGGILITLVAVFLCKRKGFGIFARTPATEEDDNRMNRDFETPNVSNEYAELDDMARCAKSL